MPPFASGADMRVDWDHEAPRLARLARLALTPEEAHALALDCEAITRDFSALAAHAAALPEPPAAASTPPRADETAPADAAEVEGILAAVPRLDAKTRKVIVPRGLP